MGGKVGRISGSLHTLSDTVEIYSKKETEGKKTSHPEIDI